MICPNCGGRGSYSTFGDEGDECISCDGTGEIVLPPKEAKLVKEKVMGPSSEKIELEMRRRFMHNLPFCPDHRDKVAGKFCRECEIERLMKKSETRKKDALEIARMLGFCELPIPKNNEQMAWAKTQEQANSIRIGQSIYHFLPEELRRLGDLG